MASTSTYPVLIAENPNLPSLANYPLDIVLIILELIFRPLQIITIDITGPPYNGPAPAQPHGGSNNATSQTRILLQPPPLNALANVCRLFRHAYRLVRPTAWGAHLHRGIPYHVDLARDLFYVRLRRGVTAWEWDSEGELLRDPLAGELAGVQRLATSLHYVVPGVLSLWGAFYLRHLNPMGAELILLVPARGLEGGQALALEPAVVPLRDGARILDGYYGGDVERPWWEYRAEIRTKLRRAALFINPANPAQWLRWDRAWRELPVPEVTGYAVDERRLKDPKAWRLKEL
jgi:hypothetical protein